ncbi:hypothetical protein L208DRAFT_1474759 [Tricholoma matsutake]|nr:hypothetical protein L208DRAFT_1474759 [Tricholoma matsutake 945]
MHTFIRVHSHQSLSTQEERQHHSYTTLDLWYKLLMHSPLTTLVLLSLSILSLMSQLSSGQQALIVLAGRSWLYVGLPTEGADNFASLAMCK